MRLSPSRFPTISLDRPWSALLAAYRPHRATSLALCLGLALVGMSSQLAQADSATWNINNAGSWVTDANWNPASAPGSTVGTTSTDVATFGAVINAARLITVDTGRNIFGIDFAGNSSGYTLQTGSLVLTDTGYIQATGAGSGHTDTISAAVTLAGNASFLNNSTAATRILAISGNVTGSATGASTLTLGGTNTSTSNTVSGIIANGAGGAVSLVKNDAGLWSLSNTNTFTGGTTVNAGTLRASSIGALGGSGNTTTLVAGSILQQNVASALTSSIGGTGTVQFTAGANHTIGALTGSGTLTLVNSAGAGSVVVDFGSATLTSFTGKLTLSNNNTANGGFRFNSATAYAGTGATWFDLTGGGTLARRDTNSANDTINLGSLSGVTGTSLSNNTTTRTTTWAIGARGDNTEFAGVISNGAGTSVVSKRGTASLTLSGANTYTGATTVQAGKLVAGTDSLVSTNGAFGNAASAIVLGNGSTLAADAPSLLINGAFIVGRDITVGSLANAAAYNATIGGSNTTGTSSFTGNITLNTTAANYTATLQAATGGAVDFNTGVWTTNNKAIVIGSSGNTGTVQFSKALSTTGGVSVNFGTFSLNIADALGAGNTTPVTVNGGALDIGGNNQTAVGPVILSSGSITGSSGVITSNATYDVRNGSVSAILGGSVGLTKTTSSTVTLSGADTYSGATTVDAGTLLVSGSIIGTTSVAVASAGTFASGATGSVTTAAGGNVSVSGSLAPGNVGSIGTLTLAPGTGGKVNFLSGSTFKFDISGASSDLVTFSTPNDWLAGSGNATLTLSGISGGDYRNTYTVFQNVSSSGFTFANITGYDTANYIANFAQVGNTYQLSFVAVPEPCAGISLLGGVGYLLGLRRFRRRAVRFNA